ncbi:MAG: hypothetical protein RL115_166 [Bacteroidota bacterium]
MQRLFFCFVFMLFAIASKAQLFGGTPPEQKWQQINTDTVRIIFAPGQEEKAKRVADIVHHMARQQPIALGSQLKKIDIVLQHQTVIANGYVGMGPFRSEFFLTPEPNSLSQGSIKWEDQLAIHEYRHVQQYNNFNNGLSKVMQVLFGQEGYALATNAAIPDWFFEGDAVYTETALTGQGRGRLPNFTNAYPSLWQANKKYSWMKLRNGSLKDYVPSHYHLGYLLVNYGRQKYGEDFWTKVTKDASAYKGLFYPFQAAIKKHAGIAYKKFYTDAFSFYKKPNSDIQLKSATQGTINQGTEAGIKNSSKQTKAFVTNYYFPYTMEDTSLIYLKSSYRERPSFYIKDKTGEHLLKVKDIATDEQYSYRNGRIVYAAYENDARWGWRDYSVLKVLDVHSKEQHTVTTKSKYFTPDISADGKKIVAVQNDAAGKSELHVLNTETGEVLQKIQSAGVYLFGDPKFVTDDLLVTTVRLWDGKMALAAATINSATIKLLTPASYKVLGYPCVKDSVVYFSASYAGNDDVYAMNLKETKFYKIANGPLGKYFINANAGKLTWSQFTSDGYQLAQMDMEQLKWKHVEVGSLETDKEIMEVSKGASTGNILDSISTAHNYTISNYKKSTGLLNFHSWRPNYDDPIFTFSLYGQNVLNTLQSELYYSYNESEKTHGAGFATTFGGWLPYLTAGTEYTFNREEQIGNRIRQWGQLDSRLGVSLPLNKTKGTTYRSFNISSFYVLRNEFNKDFYKDSLGTTSFGYLSNTISYGQQVQRARQHIFPRLGFALSASFRKAVSTYDAQQFNGAAAFYLPGAMRHHHLVVTGQWQERDTVGQVNLGNRFAYSRGYTGRNFSRMWRMSANYHFPLWHMDFGFANILYIQRIRANAFYDFTKVYSRDKSQTREQRSAGGEVYFDTKWWNQYALTFGFRVSRLLDQDQFNGFKGTKFEFILPISIFPN